MKIDNKYFEKEIVELSLIGNFITEEDGQTLVQKVKEEIKPSIKVVIIRFDKVKHIRSDAIGVLNTIYKILNECGLELKLTHLNGCLKKFKMLGLLGIFDCYKTTKEAIDKKSGGKYEN